MNKKGFTLIELLIVVAIIAILAAIAVPNFLEALTRSRVIRTIADMRSVTNAIELYKVDHNQIPTRRTYPTLRGKYLDVDWHIDFMLIEGDDEIHMGTLLTSPVAYMSDFPYDHWNSRMKEVGWGVSKFPRVSFIFSGIPHGKPFSGPTMDNRREFFRVQFSWSYFLESAGPDLVWWNAPQQGTVEAFFYDPTNGAISDGQIVTFEGPYTFPRL